MKFIILSDIHSNIYALEKCFDFIENMNLLPSFFVRRGDFFHLWDT